MSVKLLTAHHLEIQSCTGTSESTLVKMPNCWKSHAKDQMLFYSTSRHTVWYCLEPHTLISRCWQNFSSSQIQLASQTDVDFQIENVCKLSLICKCIPISFSLIPPYSHCLSRNKQKVMVDRGQSAHHPYITSTVKIILEARAFIRIITVHGDGVGPLLDATRARKVIKTSCIAPIYQ